MLSLPASSLPTWLHSRRVPLVGGLLCALVALVAVGFMAYQHRVANQQADAQAQLYTRVLEDHANRSFSAAELALNAVAEALALQDSDQPGGPQAALMQQSLQGLPFLRSVSLVAADGRILASSTAANVGTRINRDQLLLQPPTRATLGPLLPARDLAQLASAQTPHAGAMLLPLVRPLAQGMATGSPAGPRSELAGAWLVAALNPDYFANQYQLILGDSALKAALVSYTGQLIAASEDLQLPPGAQRPELPLFAQLLPNRERGDWAGPGLDGEPARAAYRSARLYPVAVVVEVPQAQIAADLARTANGVWMATAAVLACVGALCGLAWRSLRSHEASQVDLESARGTMAAQHAFTDRLFQLSPIPMVVKDLQGRFMRVNQAFVNFTGLAPEQVTGQRMDQLYPRQLAAPHQVQEEIALASLSPAAYEEQMLDSDGLPRDVMIRVTPFTGTDGQVAGTIGCLMDVSEFREAEARTLEAKGAAERANTAKSEFLANISHELRTPLQTIIGFSELGGARARHDLRVQGMFSDIHSAGHRMLALVNDLLDLSRLEAAATDSQRQPQDLAPAFAEVVHELEQLAADHGVRLQVGTADGGPALPAVWAQADRFRMQQVLRNVLANAIRFSPAGAQVQLEWGSRPSPTADGREHWVQVRDQGPGVPANELESIFEAFVQSTRTKSGAGGTGLGLTISRRILQAHEGRIHASNRPEGGAVFEFCLPAIEAPALTAQAA